jgi:hypothetical protein
VPVVTGMRNYLWKPPRSGLFFCWWCPWLHMSLHFYVTIFVVWQDWGLNSGLRSLLFESQPQILFCFSYFSGRVSHFCPGHSRQWYSFYASHVAGTTSTAHYAWLIS